MRQEVHVDRVLHLPFVDALGQGSNFDFGVRPDSHNILTEYFEVCDLLHLILYQGDDLLLVNNKNGLFFIIQTNQFVLIGVELDLANGLQEIDHRRSLNLDSLV